LLRTFRTTISRRLDLKDAHRWLNAGIWPQPWWAESSHW
jgi:hypothetical protein